MNFCKWCYDDEGLARTGFFLGLFSLVLFFIPYVQIPMSIAAILCGISGKDSERGTRARVGIAAGIVALLIGMSMMVALSAVEPYLGEISEMFRNGISY